MNQFVNAIQTQQAIDDNFTQGENGHTSYKSTLNANYDLYAAAGALRGNEDQFLVYFNLACEENLDLAIAQLFRLRNIRGGLGERQLFRAGLRYLEQVWGIHGSHYLFELILKYGRADDLWLSFNSNEMMSKVANYVAEHLNQESQHSRNIAKWLPRKPKTDDLKKFMSVLRSILKVTPKQLRQRIVSLTNVVEQKICANKWDEVNYSQVPSQAMHKLKEAFRRHDDIRYDAYIREVLNNLTKPKEEQDSNVKINAGTLYPYQLVNYKALHDSNTNLDLIKAQWNSLPDYLNGKEPNILPMLDISGSMYSNVQNKYTNPLVVDISNSLGIYLMERNKGAFHNTYLSFNEEAELKTIPLNENGEELHPLEKYNYILQDTVGYNTNFSKAIDKILWLAKKYNVSQEELPKIVLVISDMNFDPMWMNDDYGFDKKSTSTLIKDRFSQEGYEAPQFIFWNVNHNGRFVCKQNEFGFIQISGWSTSILKDVLENIDEINPIKFMLNSLQPYLEETKGLLG